MHDLGILGCPGAHDWEIYMFESVVTVHEIGELVADLDILQALKSSLFPSSVSGIDRRVGSSPWTRCARRAGIEDQASHDPQPSDIVAIKTGLTSLTAQSHQ